MKKLYIAICILFLATSSFSSSEVTIGGKTGQPHIIQVNGTSLRPRAYLNITGDSVTGVDYLGKTVITIDSVDDQVGAVTLNKWCIGDGTLVQCTENEPAGAAGATAWDDIGDPDNDGTTTIDFDHAAEATEFTTIYDAAGSFFKITDSDADVANQMYLLDLDYSADDDQALADYFRCQDAGGTVFAVQQDGDTEIYGDLAVGSNLHPTISVNGVTKSIQFGVHGDDDANTYVSYMDRASDTHSPTVAIVRARGAHGAPTQVVDDDILGQIGFFGWDDTDNDLNIGAHIRAVVNGTAGQNDLPTELIFGTTLNGETTPTDRMSISNAGVVNIVGLTASEMVITDASSNLVSAAVATYPSLAELAYVKGVSSAIQTQITTNAELVDSAAELLAIMDNTALDFGTGVITAAGFTLAANENLTLGGETIDHDGTDFVFSDSIKTTNINITGLTASEIVITDASKNVVSAPVATYPSLTELSYVKDVTSAIQTQINAKAPSASPTITTKMTLDYATASELVSTNASKELVSLAVATYPSLTELSYVKGLASAAQTQITARGSHAGQVWTGTHDFGGAVVEISNGAAVTDPASIGQIAIDSTSDQFLYYGTAQRVLTSKYEESITVEDIAAADDGIPFGSKSYARTVTNVGCRCIGTCTTKAEFSFSDSAANAFTLAATPTCATTGAATYQAVNSGGALIAGEGMLFNVTNSVSPETDWYEIMWVETVTAD